MSLRQRANHVGAGEAPVRTPALASTHHRPELTPARPPEPRATSVATIIAPIVVGLALLGGGGTGVVRSIYNPTADGPPYGSVFAIVGGVSLMLYGAANYALSGLPVVGPRTEELVGPRTPSSQAGRSLLQRMNDGLTGKPMYFGDQSIWVVRSEAAVRELSDNLQVFRARMGDAAASDGTVASADGHEAASSTVVMRCAEIAFPEVSDRSPEFCNAYYRYKDHALQLRRRIAVDMASADGARFGDVEMRNHTVIVENDQQFPG